jgi:hypothetical protein
MSGLSEKVIKLVEVADILFLGCGVAIVVIYAFITLILYILRIRIQMIRKIENDKKENASSIVKEAK